MHCEAVMTDGTIRKRVLLICAQVAVITLLYYVTIPRYAYYHTLLRNLYFLPLILSGLWFGFPGAVDASLAVTILYLPFIAINWQGMSPSDFNRILEVVLFNAVALTFGAISGAEKAKEKALRESESLTSIGKALSAVAHDLRSPIAAIGGFSRRLEKRPGVDADSREKLRTITHEAARLEAMIEDMLDFSKPLAIRYERDDLNQAIRETTIILESKAEERHVRMDLDLSPHLPPISFDASRLRQVFQNLVSNAIDASPAFGVVLVRTYCERKRVCVDVTDQGPGIPPREQGKCLYPFLHHQKTWDRIGPCHCGKGDPGSPRQGDRHRESRWRSYLQGFAGHGLTQSATLMGYQSMRRIGRQLLHA